MRFSQQVYTLSSPCALGELYKAAAGLSERHRGALYPDFPSTSISKIVFEHTLSQFIVFFNSFFLLYRLCNSWWCYCQMPPKSTERQNQASPNPRLRRGMMSQQP